MSEAIFLGTTTLKRMMKAIYNKYDPLFKRNTFKACKMALIKMKEDPSYGNGVVYMYFHSDKNETIMTTVEGDFWGTEDQSAGFSGKVELNRSTKDAVRVKKWWMP